VSGSRVVLCDDEQMVLEAMTLGVMVLGMDVVGSTTDPEVAVGMVRTHRPHVCVLDAGLPGTSGPQVAERMRQGSPDTMIVMLTAHATDDVWTAYDAGVLHAVINKTLDFASLQKAIGDLRDGARVVAGWRRLPHDRPDTPDLCVEPLTDREREVLAALVRGDGTTDIAATLDISSHTVRSHVQSVMRKLNVTTRAKATNVAVAHGLLEAS